MRQLGSVDQSPRKTREPGGLGIDDFHGGCDSQDGRRNVRIELETPGRPYRRIRWNPHVFAEDGFGVDDEASGRKRVDPHAFRVVKGSFINFKFRDKLATVAGPSNYQPLVRDAPADGELQPFFSQKGATPWCDAVKEVKSDDGVDKDLRDNGVDPSQELLLMLQKDLTTSNKKEKNSKSKNHRRESKKIQSPASGDYDHFRVVIEHNGEDER